MLLRLIKCLERVRRSGAGGAERIGPYTADISKNLEKKFAAIEDKNNNKKNCIKGN